MNSFSNTHDTRGIPGNTTPMPETVILGETGDGIVDESAITDAALLAELEEADDATEVAP